MRKATYLFLLLGLAFCLADAGGPPAVEDLLFDQFGASSVGLGVLSQQFSDVSNLRFIAADDFVVPSGQNWRIERVAIRGIFQDEKAPSEEDGAIWTVRIYASVAGKLTNFQPAATPLFEETGLQATGNDAAGSDTFGNINFTLTNPPTLTPGRYWLSVFPTKSGRAFYWEVTNLENLDPFLVNQDSGLDICTGITSTEGAKWTLPSRCPQAIVFEDGSLGANADFDTLNALVFRLEGPIVSATTTGNADTGAVVTTGDGDGAVITTGDTGIIITTGDGGIIITTGDTGVQITTDGIIVTGDGDVGSIDFSSSASTLSAFWF